MKKILTLVLLLILSSGVKAQSKIFWFESTSFAIKKVNSYGNWTEYSDWVDTTPINIKIDLSANIIEIYSLKRQTYIIKHHGKRYKDEGGGTQLELQVVDQDSDFGKVRLRKTETGGAQLYIDFSDIAWVYELRQI